MADVQPIAWSIYWKWMLLLVIGSTVGNIALGTAIGAIVMGTQGSAAMATGKAPLIIMIGSGLLTFLIGFLSLSFLLVKSIGKQIGSKKLVLVDALAAGEN